MKNDLICQTSEFDCGPTSVNNAMRLLFEREEIPPVILKHIWTMGIDTFADGGETGKKGRFPIRSEFLDMEYAEIVPGSIAWECLKRGGCAVMRCTTGGIPHYVLLTGLLPEGGVALFDPYDEEPEFDDPGRRYVSDQPKRMNRAVRMEYLNRTDESDYAMGPLEKRELLLFWRTDEGEAASHE